MTDDLRQRIERAAQVLKEHGAREVYLFGSAAKDTMREGSDVDLAVAGLPPEEFRGDGLLISGKFRGRKFRGRVRGRVIQLLSARRARQKNGDGHALRLSREPVPVFLLSQ